MIITNTIITNISYFFNYLLKFIYNKFLLFQKMIILYKINMNILVLISFHCISLWLFKKKKNTIIIQIINKNKYIMYNKLKLV